MRWVSFDCEGKKLLFPLVTVFIVIISCCISPSAFLLTQGHAGLSFDLCRERPDAVPIGTLTAGNGPFSSSLPETDGLPTELVNLTEPTAPASLVNIRTRNKTFFPNTYRLFNVGAMFFLPRILGKPYFLTSEDLFPSAFHTIKTIRKLE